MTQADMKLKLIREIDRLSSERLTSLYELLLEILRKPEMPENVQEMPSHIKAAVYEQGEKPSDFAGIWETLPNRDANLIRKQAWGLEE